MELNCIYGQKIAPLLSYKSNLYVLLEFSVFFKLSLKNVKRSTLTKAASPKKPEPKKVEKPAKAEKKTAPAKKAGAKKPAKKVVKETSESSGPPKEAEFSDDIAIDKCNEVFGENVVKEVQNSAWKARLEHLQIMNNKCSILGEFSIMHTRVGVMLQRFFDDISISRTNSNRTYIADL